MLILYIVLLKKEYTLIRNANKWPQLDMLVL